MKFVLASDFKMEVSAVVYYKTLDGQESTETFKPDFCQSHKIKPPKDIVVLVPYSGDIGDMLEVSDYDEQYYDYGYWSVLIDGQFYEARDWFTNKTDKPDWATHFTYYSK